jgi:hypothetical protein
MLAAVQSRRAPASYVLFSAAKSRSGVLFCLSFVCEAVQQLLR